MNRLLVVRGIVEELIDKITVAPGKDLEQIKKNELTHSYGVAAFAQMISKKRGLNTELAAITGHLHDIGRIIHNILDETHGCIGADEARRILTGTGLFSSEEIDIICCSIMNHMDKHLIHGPFDEVLKDADLMERYFWKAEYIKDIYKLNRLNNVFSEFGTPHIQLYVSKSEAAVR